MMAKRLPGLALAMALLSAALPAAANPHWGSDQIRAARPTQAVEALVFEVKTEVSEPGKPTTTTLSTVTLAPTFSHRVTAGEEDLADHSLCRMLAWKTGAASLGNSSCYTLPAARVFELQNRDMIRRAISAGDPAKVPAFLQPYWVEAELGVQTGTDARVQAVKTQGRTEYRLGKEVVAQVEGQAGALSPEEIKRFRRYLTRAAGLHPQVRREIAALPSMPATIRTALMTGDKRRDVVMNFSNLRRQPVAYPLPAGLVSRVREDADKGDGAQALAYRQVLLTIEGKTAAQKPSLNSLIAGMKMARDPLQAQLLFVNITQQYAAVLKPGKQMDALIADIGPIMGMTLQDPVASQFAKANTLAGDPRGAGDRPGALKFLAEAGQMDAMAFGTFRYVTYANLLRVSGDGKGFDKAVMASMPGVIDSYWTHIAAYPWAANAYKDVGDAYMQDWNMDQAWTAFDLGRAADPDWRSGMMANVDRLEAQLTTREPDFF